QLAGGAAQGVCLERAQRVAAGGDERLYAVELEVLTRLERDAEQWLHPRLVSAPLQHGSELERVGLGTGDEKGHQEGARKKPGPASSISSAAASSAMAMAVSGRPSRRAAWHRRPSGVRISPRNRRRSGATSSARPAIGVLHEPSSLARKAR